MAYLIIMRGAGGKLCRQSGEDSLRMLSDASPLHGCPQYSADILTEEEKVSAASDGGPKSNDERPLARLVAISASQCHPCTCTKSS